MTTLGHAHDASCVLLLNWWVLSQSPNQTQSMKVLPPKPYLDSLSGRVPCYGSKENTMVASCVNQQGETRSHSCFSFS